MTGASNRTRNLQRRACDMTHYGATALIGCYLGSLWLCLVLSEGRC